MSKLTIKTVRAELKKIDMVILHNEDGEYVVDFRGATRDTAYFTTDLNDALNTGVAMHVALCAEDHSFGARSEACAQSNARANSDD